VLALVAPLAAACSSKPGQASVCRSQDALQTATAFVAAANAGQIETEEECVHPDVDISSLSVERSTLDGLLVGKAGLFGPPNPDWTDIPDDLRASAVAYQIPFPPVSRCLNSAATAPCGPDFQGGAFITLAPDDHGDYGVIAVGIYSSG
jgi:hypothetical protein